MAFLSPMKKLCSALKCNLAVKAITTLHVRNLMSKQLVYNEFGDPLHVVKYRECQVPSVGPEEVLVRMLAAPVNPADINTIQGMYGT